jgi:hypothetical protein
MARIEGGFVSIDRLHDAFREVQRRHPALRAAIDIDTDGIPHFVRADSTVEICLLERSSDTQWQTEVEAQLVAPFHPMHGSLAAILLSLPDPVARCLAPVNIRHLCPPVADDFGLYISSGTTSLAWARIAFCWIAENGWCE